MVPPAPPHDPVPSSELPNVPEEWVGDTPEPPRPAPAPPGKGRMASQAGVVGILTLVSRVFGLARDAVIAYTLGTKAAADAFYVAFRIPNLLRRMLAEGNLTISFVPVFTESLHRSQKEAKEVADVTFTLLTLVLTAVTLFGVLGASWFVHLTAWGFTEDPKKFALTVALTRITFPYIFLVSLGALMMGILNAKKHFAMPALAPVLLNVGIILGTLVLSPYFSQPSIGIAWGVLIGGVLQLLIQVPILVKKGFLPRFNFHFKIPGVRKILRLMGPTLYGSAVYQINILVMTFLASFLPSGSISYLWYADRVMEFPLGVFAISLATVALPLLSDHAVKKDHAKLKATLREVLSMVWLVNIPAAVGLAVLAQPILALLFFRGDFGISSTQQTAQALYYFALGLPFISAARITASAFYALQEARKPVRAANLSVVVNILAGGILFFPMGHRGLALAVSLGGAANLALLLFYYRKQVGPLGLKSLLQDTAKIVLASAIMGGALLWIMQYWNLTFAPLWHRLFFVMVLIVAGAIIYGVLAWALGIEGLRPLRAAVQRRLKGRRP